MFECVGEYRGYNMIDNRYSSTRTKTEADVGWEPGCLAAFIY
jgi:hypothetical protein